MAKTIDAAAVPRSSRARPLAADGVGDGAPGWLLLATGLFSLLILFMALAETNRWKHFLVDRGEHLSLLGLAAFFAVGLDLFRKGRLLRALPLSIPWLLHPLLTQGDQLIDNLSIGGMRVIVHAILLVLFSAPIAILILAGRSRLSARVGTIARNRWWTHLFPGLRRIEQGAVREGSYQLALGLVFVAIWVAQAYLGAIMVAVLGVLGLLLVAAMGNPLPLPHFDRRRGETLALAALVAGTAISLSVYVACRNWPGAYQGSPHYYYDPTRPDAAYDLRAVAPQPQTGETPQQTLAEARRLLDIYGRAASTLLDGYYILDRNYNYAFHNALFLRNTPLAPEFRQQGLGEIRRAERLQKRAHLGYTEIQADTTIDDSFQAFLADLDAYIAFAFRRAATLERMSGEFEKTPAGLQHATHLYEGEGKALGEGILAIVEKHTVVRESGAVAEATTGFRQIAHEIHRRYADRIVGF